MSLMEEKKSYFMDKAKEKSQEKDKHMTVSGVGRDGPWMQHKQTIVKAATDMALQPIRPVQPRHGITNPCS